MNYFYQATNFPSFGTDLVTPNKEGLIERWHQAKAIQQTPRYSRTEGSPLKSQVPATSRGTLRRPPALKQFVSSEKDKEPAETARTASTPYRLPRLSETRSFTERPKEYVYKQPLTSAHFLIRKDPKRATPLPDCTSPDLRIKPNSTKCRPITQSVRRSLMYQTWPQDGAKMHRLLPKLNQSQGVIMLTDSQSAEPKTPPQSEAEYGVLPTLPVPNSSRQMTAASGQIQHNLAPVLTSDDSDERKLHWQLSPYSNKNFDRQGLGPNQGPFSREMPIKCMPPNNWLRMKLRQRIAGKL